MPRIKLYGRLHVHRRLLAEVLKDLQRAGLGESQRGAAGGYALSRPPEAVTLGEIVAALEGPPALTSCEGLGAGASERCEVESVCPIRSPLQRVREGIWTLLQGTTLSSLARSPIHFGHVGHSGHGRAVLDRTVRTAAPGAAL